MRLRTLYASRHLAHSIPHVCPFIPALSTSDSEAPNEGALKTVIDDLHELEGLQGTIEAMSAYREVRGGRNCSILPPPASSGTLSTLTFSAVAYCISAPKWHASILLARFEACRMILR